MSKARVPKNGHRHKFKFALFDEQLCSLFITKCSKLTKVFTYSFTYCYTLRMSPPNKPQHKIIQSEFCANEALEGKDGRMHW